MAETWSTELVDIEQALENPDGRVFRRKDGRLVDSMKFRGLERTAYPCVDEVSRLYYTVKGSIFQNIPGTYDEDIVAVLVPVVVERWSSDPTELAAAILSPEGRVFKTRKGDIVDDVTDQPEGIFRPNTKYPAFSTSTGWYYRTDGRLYDWSESNDDLVSVRIEEKPKHNTPVETTENPDFLRLLSYAKNEESAEIIKREYHAYRLTETLHLKMLGFTGKRKSVSWESASKLRSLLDVDRMCDSIPWTISEGENIHDVFEKHRPGSCMRDSCKHYLRQLYALNPTKVKTAHHAKSTHGLLQSAISCLVWYGKDKVYIDRRYTDGYLSGMKEPLMRSLARQLKVSTGKDVLLVWKGDDIPGIDTISSEVKFTLNRDSDLMPWCDSIRYVVEYDDYTVTLSTSEKNSRLCCQDQSGTDITETPCKCCSCGCRVDEDNSQTGEDGNTYCDDCYREAYAYCNWNGQDYSSDDVSERRVYSYGSSYEHRCLPSSLGYRNRVATWSTMCISDNAISNHFTELQDGSYCHNDLVVEDNRGNYYAPDDDGEYVVTENGEIYHPDDVCQTVDDETHPKENCQELHNGTWCLSEYAVEIDGEWYHDDSKPELVDTSEDSEGEETKESQQDETTDNRLPPGWRMVEPGEIIQQGDMCCGWGSVDPIEKWFVTGDAGIPVFSGEYSLRYARRTVRATVQQEVPEEPIGHHRQYAIAQQFDDSNGLFIPPGYRLAQLGELLPEGSRYLQEYRWSNGCPSEWCLSGECGKLFGETTMGSRTPYIVPVDHTADTLRLNIVFPSLESSVTR